MAISATRRQSALLSGCALVALLAGAPALAQVTPEDVWTSWKAALEDVGQTVAFGAATRAGAVLTVTAVTLSQPTDGPDVTVELGDIAFADQGDGSVAITLAPAFALTVKDRPGSGDNVDARIVMRQEGLEFTASGSPREITYDFAADALTVGVEHVIADGKPVDAVLDLAVGTLAGSYSYVAGEAPSLASELAAESLKLDLRVVNPEGEGRMVMAATAAGIETSSSIDRLDLMEALEDNEVGPALAAGFALATDFAIGATEFSFEFEEPGEQARISGETAGGSVAVEMSAEKLAYSVANTGARYTVSGSEIPFPEVTVAFDDLAFGFSVPASAATEPQDFSVLLRLVNLGLDEGLWSMIDPVGGLPHDPATLVADIAGRLAWTHGLFAPETMGADSFPGEMHALELKDLQVEAVGVGVTGKGAFIFDNADRETYPGLPRPMGEVEVTASGITTLMDKLVAMGLLPQEEATSAKFMLGLFARVVEGESDTYTTKVELTPEGGIVANGQPLQ